MILLDARGLGAARPEKPLFAEVSLTLASGDRVAVVGLNGSGKSTLLRQIAGRSAPGPGTVQRGRGSRLVALDQDAPLPAGTVADVVGTGWEAAAVLDRLGMTEAFRTDVADLSGGQAKRVALAVALVAVGEPGHDDDSVALILDEPTNHLDLDAIAWLEDRLASFRGGLVLVTHDRHVLDRVCTRLLELDRGRPFVHEGGYASYLEGRARREERAAEAELVRRNLARTELAWLRRGAPARTRKSKARIESATALISKAPEPTARPEQMPLHIDTPRLGDTVVELHGVGHRFPLPRGVDGPWLFRGAELALDPRERLGVVGPNGAGKSTLLDIIAGRVVPAEGRVVTGSTARVLVYDQRGRDLDPNLRVRQAIAGPHREPDWRDARLLEAFWFGTDAQHAPIGQLSGGERRRLQLILTLAERPNVLLLDEPTNDLDLDTLRQLEDVLDDWPGALVVASHDRAFLERTVSDVVVVDEGRDVARVPGGFGAWWRERVGSRRRGRAGSAVPSARRPPGRSGAARSGAARSGAARSGAAPSGAAPSGAAPSSAPRPSPSPPQGPGRARMPPSHRRKLLKAAERDVERLTRRRDVLTTDLTNAGTDGAALAAIGRDLTEVEASLAEAEDRWLSLSVDDDG